MTQLVTEPDPTYIRSLFKTAAPTSRLRRTRAQVGATILLERRFRPYPSSVRPPGSTRTDCVLEDYRICF